MLSLSAPNEVQNPSTAWKELGGTCPFLYPNPTRSLWNGKNSCLKCSTYIVCALHAFHARCIAGSKMLRARSQKDETWAVRPPMRQQRVRRIILLYHIWHPRSPPHCPPASYRTDHPLGFTNYACLTRELGDHFPRAWQLFGGSQGPACSDDIGTQRIKIHTHALRPSLVPRSCIVPCGRSNAGPCPSSSRYLVLLAHAHT